jgi:hypothetical protein
MVLVEVEQHDVAAAPHGADAATLEQRGEVRSGPVPRLEDGRRLDRDVLRTLAHHLALEVPTEDLGLGQLEHGTLLVGAGRSGFGPR